MKENKGCLQQGELMGSGIHLGWGAAGQSGDGGGGGRVKDPPRVKDPKKPNQWGEGGVLGIHHSEGDEFANDQGNWINFELRLSQH
jgi:hypothetical protein